MLMNTHGTHVLRRVLSHIHKLTLSHLGYCTCFQRWRKPTQAQGEQTHSTQNDSIWPLDRNLSQTVDLSGFVIHHFYCGSLRSGYYIIKCCNRPQVHYITWTIVLLKPPPEMLKKDLDTASIQTVTHIILNKGWDYNNRKSRCQLYLSAVKLS